MFWTHSVAQSYQRALRDESHIDFHTHCVIMTQRTWPPATCYLSHLQIFDKIDRFPKNVFRIRKANCIFEELSNLCLIVLQISFSPLLLWITAESRTKLKKLFIWTTKLGGAQHHKQTAPDYPSATASDILDWTWYLHYFWLQEFIQQQT